MPKENPHWSRYLVSSPALITSIYYEHVCLLSSQAILVHAYSICRTTILSGKRTKKSSILLIVYYKCAKPHHILPSQETVLLYVFISYSALAPNLWTLTLFRSHLVQNTDASVVFQLQWLISQLWTFRNNAHIFGRIIFLFLINSGKNLLSCIILK